LRSLCKLKFHLPKLRQLKIRGRRSVPQFRVLMNYFFVDERKLIMRSPRVYSASALTFALLLASLFVGNTAQTKARQDGSQKATVLFVVSAGQLPNADIVPFVIIEQGKFKQPVAGDSDAKEISS